MSARIKQLWQRLTIGRGTGHPLSRKMLVETLSIAQSRIGASPLDRHRTESDIARLQHLINLIEEPKR